MRILIPLVWSLVFITVAFGDGQAASSATSSPTNTTANPSPSIWTNSAGKTILATQVGLDVQSQTIQLKTGDGKIYKIAVTTLSKEDMKRALAWVTPGAIVENPKVNQIAHDGYWEKDKQDDYLPAMAMLEKPAPALNLSDWEHKTVASTSWKGKIVLIDFWATWCGPCLEQIPHANEIAKKYADNGVIVIGACCPDGSESMAKTAEDNHMIYPTGKLSRGDMANWFISFWPTYAIVDRTGKLRAIGLYPDYVEKALDELLIEQPPS